MAVANRNPSGKTTLAQSARNELREYALLSAYLFVCFGALLLYKAAILSVESIDYLPSGLAAVKALILAKFVSSDT